MAGLGRAGQRVLAHEGDGALEALETTCHDDGVGGRRAGRCRIGIGDGDPEWCSFDTVDVLAGPEPPDDSAGQGNDGGVIGTLSLGAPKLRDHARVRLTLWGKGVGLRCQSQKTHTMDLPSDKGPTRTPAIDTLVKYAG